MCGCFFFSVAMSPLSSRSPCFVSFLLVRFPLLFLPFDSPLTTLLTCSGLALLFITTCTGEEKAPGFQLEAEIYCFWLVLIIIKLLHFISPNIFGDPHSHLLLQILSPFFHCYAPFSLPACISLYWYFELKRGN